MTAHQINRLSAKVIFVLSLLALLTILAALLIRPNRPNPMRAPRHISFSCPLRLWRYRHYFFFSLRIGSRACEPRAH